MAIALDQFVKNLTDSGVLSAGKLENFIPPKAHPKDAQELAKELVRQRHLTKYQAAEIYLGRAGSLILGNYTILDKIGAGGMGQVFKAKHRRMDRIVAIKMLPKNVMKDAATIARFEREVRAAAKLGHPNIVTAYDADEAGGIIFLVMEYVEGTDLSALVKKDGPFSVAKAVNYTLQAAKGLEFAHGEGVIHRDIKPANLLLDKKGTVKILDMGLARIEAGGDAATQAELTGTGAVMGTVDYMAPEQALSTKHAEARSDIYSLGCTLYYLVAGKPTYDGDSLMAKLLAHREKPIPSLGADVPKQIQSVFEKMVAKNADDRYQTMTEVVADLQESVSSGSTVGGSQTSVKADSELSSLSFLQDAPSKKFASHTAAHKKPAIPSSTAGKGISRNGKLAIVGGALLVLIVLAGVLLTIRTKDGTLIVQIDQPDAVVEVLDEQGKIEITQPGSKGTVSISVDPGKHRLKIEKDGFAVFGQDFVIESGGKQSIKATLGEEKPWFKPDFKKWEQETAALPAEEQVKAVVKKLQELNPKFDGKYTGWWWNAPPVIEDGVVTQFGVMTDDVTDLSPVRALRGLTHLSCAGTSEGSGRLADLSPLRGIPLATLNCSTPNVADLTPLQGMPLTTLYLVGTSVTPAGVAALRKTLPETCIIHWDGPAKVGKAWESPAFRQWEKETAALPAEEQVKAVVKKLIELNPGFDGKEKHEIEGGVVTKLYFLSDEVADISPLRGLKGLGLLACSGTDTHACKFGGLSPLAGMTLHHLYCNNTQVSDLSPLRGMPLTILTCGNSLVSDLTPLQGMKLTDLGCWGTQVTDLSPLRGMPLTTLNCCWTQVSDLSPLEGMPLTNLFFNGTPVSDLTPLQGMNLAQVWLTPKNITKGMNEIRKMTDLKTIGIGNEEKDRFTPAEFWRKYGAGEFGKPDSTTIAPDPKPVTTYLDPAFKKWMKEVAALPAEQQVKAVVKKLQELNPGFDGKVTGIDWLSPPRAENGVITEFALKTDTVSDISPMRALTSLRGSDKTYWHDICAWPC